MFMKRYRYKDVIITLTGDRPITESNTEEYYPILREAKAFIDGWDEVSCAA